MIGGWIYSHASTRPGVAPLVFVDHVGFYAAVLPLAGVELGDRVVRWFSLGLEEAA